MLFTEKSAIIFSFIIVNRKNVPPLLLIVSSRQFWFALLVHFVAQYVVLDLQIFLVGVLLCDFTNFAHCLLLCSLPCYFNKNN